MDAFWTILAASLVALSCSLLGCFLVLRKMAMLGDAISHSILPGILLAFLLTGERNTLGMFLGASSLGLLATFIIEFLHQKGRLPSDAVIGITFTSLFAVGIILINLFAEQVDLDQDCVLYGEIAYVPIDVWITENNTNMGPRVVWIMSVVSLLNLLFVIIAYKALKITTFDPAFAATMGISVGFWHYVLMGAVSVTTVAAFESVGAILVLALLIAPAATAYLLTEQLKKMLLLAAFIGILTAIGGYYLAWFLDASIAGAMSAVVGIFFVLALLFSPSSGILVKKWKSLKPITA